MEVTILSIQFNLSIHFRNVCTPNYFKESEAHKNVEEFIL